MRNLNQSLDKAEIAASNYTVSSLAAAEAVLSRQQKEAGTMVVDIGAGTTNLIVIEDGEVQHVAVIPVGGTNLTNDLAIGLKTDLDVAEKIKLEHASLKPDTQKQTASVKIGRQVYDFSYEEVSMITEARIEELLEYVDKELHKIKRSRKLPGGIVLTGASSKLPGLAEYTRDKLQLPARIGHIQNVGGIVDTVDNNAYCSVIGLMMLDMMLLPSANLLQGGSYKTSQGIADKLLSRFKKR